MNHYQVSKSFKALIVSEEMLHRLTWGTNQHGREYANEIDRVRGRIAIREDHLRMGYQTLSRMNDQFSQRSWWSLRGNLRLLEAEQRHEKGSLKMLINDVF